MEMQLQTKDTLATLHLDPRTKLYLLIVGNVALFLAPSLLYEIALVVCVVILGVLVGAKRFTVRMAAVYAGMVVLHIIGTNYLTGTLQIAIVTFTVFIRKIFPCAMLGGILVSTTRVNEFMAAMNRIHMRELYDEYGNPHLCVDEELRRRLETKLITKLLTFRVR